MEESERWCLQMHSPTKITLGARSFTILLQSVGLPRLWHEYGTMGSTLAMRKFYMKIFTIE